MTQQGLTTQFQSGGIAATWEEKLGLIQQMYPNAAKAELELFFHQAKRMQLDPLARQIHLVSRWDSRSKAYKSAVQVGIDGYRSIADRTGHYAGNDDPLFDEGLSQYAMISAGRKQPVTATCTVYKVVGGVRCPFTATATWEAYAPKTEGTDFMWRKMPFLMLSKCAEALALRKAFPAELSGVYTDAEMEQAGPAVTVHVDQQFQAPAAVTIPTAMPPQEAHNAPKQAEIIPAPKDTAKAPPTAQKPAQAQNEAPPVDTLDENAVEDLRAALGDCQTGDEAERLHNRFANAYKGKPATVSAAYDLYQIAKKRLGSK